MTLKLYYTMFSPPSRSVMILLKILNIPHELKPVNLFKAENFSPEFLKMNPQHSVPVLDDNGFLVLDSHAINSYLMNAYAKDDKLYPKEPKARAIVDHRLHFDTGVMFPVFRNVVRGYRLKTLPGMTPEMVENFNNVYEMVERFLDGHKFIAGNDITIADISAITSLTTMEFLWPPNSEKFPLILAYIQRCQKEIPHFAAVNEAGIEAARTALKGFKFKL